MRIPRPFLPRSARARRAFQRTARAAVQTWHAGITSAPLACVPPQRLLHSAPIQLGSKSPDELTLVRNCGIFAHIDAGKTTTTERMLYFSGATNTVGEVHDGDTVTDWLPQERERGITIQSAAVTFGWAGSAITLIDTPGHVDFTVEVERCARVLDGAIIVLDSVAGVEAQTETVWAQTARYALPKIAFANKLDREGASYSHTAKSIQKKLGATPLCVHLPVGEYSEFHGVVDLVTMEYVWFAGEEGSEVRRASLADAASAASVPPAALAAAGCGLAALAESAAAARQAMLDAASEFDDQLADALLAGMDADDDGLGLLTADGLDAAAVQAALRRITLQPDAGALVLLAGSAYKNKGVQLLMDAVLAYLPSPADVPALVAHPVQGLTKRKTSRAAARRASQAADAEGAQPGVPVYATPNAPLVAYAFKVGHHPTRGALTYFRVYSGEWSVKLPVLNTTRGTKERASKLLQMFGDETREVQAIPAGHIGAAVGLKSTCTGDTLVLAADPSPVELPPVQLPQPVFTAALETDSPTAAKALEAALAVVVREDPSLTVTTDEDTGQVLLSGMGELHLDITMDRLHREHKVEAELGRRIVAYKESATLAGEGCAVFDKTLGGTKHWAKIALRVEPMPGEQHNEVVLGGTSKVAAVWCGDGTESGAQKPLPRDCVEALHDAIDGWLTRGPKFGGGLIGMRVVFDSAASAFNADTTVAAVRAAAAAALHAALPAQHSQIMEPMMRVEVAVQDAHVGRVMTDLTSHRRAHIIEVAHPDAGQGSASAQTRVAALTPLREMLGYATVLRSMTAGEGTFSLEFAQYDALPQLLEEAVRHEMY